jgi:hypothetical protein
MLFPNAKFDSWTRTRARRLLHRSVQGNKLPFDEESARIYDVVTPHYDRARSEGIHKQIDALLPGPGTTAERMQAFREQLVIPRDKLEAVFKAAIAGCREQTAKHIKLPEGESFDLEFVTHKPWGGYNWYKGGYHSLIQINVELPIYIDRALDIGCHEGYPGHHVYNIYPGDPRHRPDDVRQSSSDAAGHRSSCSMSSRLA